MSTEILDCTLRDGGYINDWKFEKSCFENIIEGLQKADVNYIEVGILGKRKEQGFTTKFERIEDIPRLPKINGKKSEFTVMSTYSEAKNIKIPLQSQTEIDIIRVAYFKDEYKEAIEYGKQLKQLGYKIFFQAMATFMYSEKEMLEMVGQINDSEADAFYMVDSFGTMFPNDVAAMFHLINNKLDDSIMFGFHAHNNLQMALGNVIAFIDCADKRNICVDASIYGMGRGAGNVNMELLMEYMNKKQGADYDTFSILKLFQDNLSSDFSKYYWGYQEYYFLTAQKQMNGVYIWYLLKKGVRSIEDIEEILSKLPQNAKHTLKKELVDQLIHEIVSSKENAVNRKVNQNERGIKAT